MASEELPMTGSRVILRRESNMCHSTTMIPAPWTSSVEFPRVPYWDHYYSLYMSMISPMFHLYYLHYCLQMIPMSLSPEKIYQLYLQRWIVNLSDCRNGWMSTNSLLMWKDQVYVILHKKPSVILNDVVLNCEIIEKVEHFKFLGVHIDSKLNWSYHIQCIRKKMSKGNGILYRAKDYLKCDTLLTLYYSFIYPYIVYCIEVWGSTTKGNLVSLLKCQKRVLRIIKSVPTRTDSAPLFLELGNLISL